MTSSEFDALLDTLPNGLHDADLVSLTVDLGAADVHCVIDADLSAPADPASAGRTLRVRLSFAGVSFVVIDPPAHDLATLPRTWIDAGSGQPGTAARPALAAPEDGFLAWIFLREANSFLRIGARRASMGEIA